MLRACPIPARFRAQTEPFCARIRFLGTTAALPLCSASVLWSSRFEPLETAPLASERQVPTFHTRARLSFAPPTRRMPLGRSSGNPRTRPGRRVSPRFRHRLIRFRRFISGSLALASLGLTCRDHRPDFSATLTTMAFAVAWDQLLIAEPEGPSFISRTVAKRRLDRRYS